MNVKNLIAAAVVFAAAGSAFAADVNTAAAAAAPAAASASAAALASNVASNLNVPAVTINGASRNRAEVRAEAVEFAKNYKTALSVQLDQYKN